MRTMVSCLRSANSTTTDATGHIKLTGSKTEPAQLLRLVTTKTSSGEEGSMSYCFGPAIDKDNNEDSIEVLDKNGSYLHAKLDLSKMLEKNGVQQINNTLDEKLIEAKHQQVGMNDEVDVLMPSREWFTNDAILRC